MDDKRNFPATWDKAAKDLKENGIVTIITGGGETWNNRVAERLAEMIGSNVVLMGEHPLHRGAFQYSMKLDNNQQAKVLLTKDDIR